MIKNACYLLFLLIPLHHNAQVINIELSPPSSNKNAEWDFLYNYLGKDSIVCLGEESHWIETYLALKNGMIKNLHEKGGFQVLIFESGFINSFVAHIEQLASKDRLKETLYPLWRTQSTLDLIEYIDASHHSTSPLLQLGCDIKGPASYRFSNLIKQVCLGIDPELGESSSSLDSNFMKERVRWEPEIGKAYRGKYLTDKVCAVFQRGYQDLLRFVQRNKNLMAAQQNWTAREVAFFERCIVNRLYLLNLMQLPSYQQKHRYRDEKMSENLQWFIEEYVPYEKYIIWAADLHISKDAQWELNGAAWKENKSMIECLSEQIEQPIFSIGIKSLSSLGRETRKRVKKELQQYGYIDLLGPNEGLFQEFRNEHDGLVICRKIQSIRKYQIERKE